METLDDQTRGAVDERPRRRRMLPVLITGIAGLAAGLYLRAVDPNVPGHYPGCPSQIFLGLDCPGCGGMRGTYDLLYGDLSGMADHNALLIAFWPVVIVRTPLGSVSDVLSSPSSLAPMFLIPLWSLV